MTTIDIDFSHLSDDEAFRVIQETEQKLDLVRRRRQMAQAGWGSYKNFLRRFGLDSRGYLGLSPRGNQLLDCLLEAEKLGVSCLRSDAGSGKGRLNDEVAELVLTSEIERLEDPDRRKRFLEEAAKRLAERYDFTRNSDPETSLMVAVGLKESIELGEMEDPQAGGELDLNRSVRSAGDNGEGKGRTKKQQKLEKQRQTERPPKLIDQPYPPYQRPNFVGNLLDLITFPAIKAEDADHQRRFNPDPPNATPFDLFGVKWNMCTAPGVRFIRKGNRKQMLMFIDGACSDNQHQSISRGGSGVVYTCVEYGSPLMYPLNHDGNRHTSNRAELMAAILPLGMRYWPGEGFNNIVMACDSEYVVKGITEWLPAWIKRGWRTSAGKIVKNRDLWEKLVEALRKQEKKGVLVQFWQIPRELNEADEYAKKAAVSAS